MMRSIVLTLCVLVAFSNPQILKPRDLADEAQEQLDELMSIVRGDILVAYDDLNDLSTDFQAYTADIYENGVIDLQQEYQNVDSQVSALVDLAIGSGHDVTSCTNIREDVLERLPVEYGLQIAECIADINQGRESVLENARFIIGSVVNRVSDISSQLRNCRGEILCLTPIVTEIQLNKIRLPQNIQTEVLAVESLLTTLRLSIQTCSDTSVAEFTTRANSILRDITACIDRIIG